MSTLKKLYNEKIKQDLQKELKLKNPMEIPKLSKIVINRGLGEAVSNSKLIEVSLRSLSEISGQKPVILKAKKAISNFKIRENLPIGCKVTLRSDRMFDFLTKLINISLPNIRDFRGISKSAFDGMGNYTLGIKDDSIFPEMNLDKVDKVRGYDISFVTTAKTDGEAKLLLQALGMPFRK